MYICPHSPVPVPWISECTHGGVLSNTIPFQNNNPIRVVIHEQSNKGRNHTAGKLVYLAGSLEELMKAGEEKFGDVTTRVLTVEGAEVDGVHVLRDGDHLFLS